MKRSWSIPIWLVVLVILGCRPGQGKEASPPPEEGWSVTAWGERYEVFAETGALVTERTTTSNAHVTVLDGFAPLREGAVTIAFRGNGPGQDFRQEKPKRDGIFPVEIAPVREGTFDLVFLVDGPSGLEEIPAGGVRVGSAQSPGGREVSGEVAADSVPFLKEQQWRTEFATAWAREGAIHDSVSGPARVTPSANGAATLTASVDATVTADVWPYPGLELPRGRAVFRLVPRMSGRSVPDLEADVVSLEAEADAARRRVDRLTELFRVEATSAAELERGRAALASLEARLQAARRGVGAPLSGKNPAVVSVPAPWSGTVAEVFVSPGETVSAGTPLVRVVRVRPIWFVLALRPEDADRVPEAPAGLVLRRRGTAGVLELAAQELRIVSRAPELDRQTGSVGLIVEAKQGVAGLPIGTTVEADLLLAGERRGVVVPASALIDDAGVLVTYVQLDGESFARREVRVLAREGSDVLVEGIKVGERVVTRGGGAIRRSALLGSGAPEGHVH